MGLGQGGHGEKKKKKGRENALKRIKECPMVANRFGKKKTFFHHFFFRYLVCLFFFLVFFNFFLLVERVGRPGSGCGPHDALRGRNEE